MLQRKLLDITCEGVKEHHASSVLKELLNDKVYMWHERNEKGQSRAAISNHPDKGRTLYVYVVAATKAVSTVLLAKRKGKQCLIRYVNRMLNEAERNYAPLEKLAMSLLHMSRRLRRYFKAHPIKVITAPMETPTKEFFRLPANSPNKDELKRWTLFTDGASNSKVSGAGLILISLSGVEFPYALRLNFTSTNNEAKYEALLVGLRMAKKIKVQNIDVKVDSKLVVSQINGSYMESSASMIKYLATAKECIAELTTFVIQNIPRNLNQMANILSKLAAYAFHHLTKKVLVEIHMRSCGMHIGARSMVAKAIRKGYYWSTMHRDARNVTQKCDSCQVHASAPRRPKTLMTSIMVPWPFYQWGMDILGPLPQAARKSKFVIVAIDYFTKWIEAKPLSRITRKDAVERAYKSLMKGIKARLGSERAGWVDELPNVLWAHRTSLKQSNGETPVSLTYGSEAVIPADIIMPTHRTMMIREDENEDELRLNMDLLQERREVATIRKAKYKTKMEQYYNQKVRPMSFKPNEYVFQRNEASREEDQVTTDDGGIRKNHRRRCPKGVPVSLPEDSSEQATCSPEFTGLPSHSVLIPANSGEWPMPVWCRMFQQTLDGSARGWFENLPHGSIDEWVELRLQFTTRFSTRRACFKDPAEITKIMRRANKTLVAFKERWIVETSFITGVPEVIKISSFNDAHKYPELAARYSDKVPKTVDEIMTRLDDFVRSEEAFSSTELPKGEVTAAEPAATEADAASPQKGKPRQEEKISRKGRGLDEGTDLISPLSMEDASDEPLIIDAVMEGYLVRMVYMDQGESVEVINLSKQCKNQLKVLLKKSTDVFAWEPADITGIPRRIIEHTLNVNPSIEPVAQKRRVLASDRTQVISREVEEWVNAGIVRPVRYPTWISNSMLVKKSDERWRMRMDFKNIKSACPKDHYALPVIDEKIESIVGFRYKCFLDAYKGYHQVQMAPDDKEMTAFYTNEGTYCYTKMPFGHKNAGATYQRLKVLNEDIAETFDNLRRINMKLNPEKCLFEVEEGKFLGNAEPKWKAVGIKKILVLVCRKVVTLLRNPKRHNKGKQGRIPLDEKREEGIPGNEKGHSIAAISNHPDKGGNVVRICSSSDGGRKYRVTGRKKGEAMSDTLREQDVERSRKELCSIGKVGHVISPNKDELKRWTLFTDGASNTKVLGVGLILISPSGVEFPYALRLNFTSTNNEAEYEALLVGLRMAKKMKVQNIDVKVDSKLVASQINGSYMESSASMIKYLATAKECIAELTTFVIQNIPRNLNLKADILSKLATHAFHHLTKKVLVEVLVERSTDRKEANYVIRTLMTSIMVPWPFYQWGIDILGPLPQAARKSKFVIVAIDYFTKWIEAKPLAKITRKDLMKFVWDNIVCKWAVERANKSLMEGIKARLGSERAGWVDELPNVLWAHRTSLKQSNGEPPASLTYGSEVVIPADIGMPTHRTMMIREDENEDELRLNMDLLQERREVAIIREAKYKTKMEQYYNQKVRPMSFKSDEYVFQRNEASRAEDQGVWPEDKDQRRALRMKINQYVLEEGVLFKKGYLVPMLRCVGPLQANYVIREIHMRSYGMHIGARSVVAKAIRKGYYWTTMHRDALNVTQKHDPCQ
nr:reverse transcriptase domain-containing protein [Tanacetum cinerariifolium]